MSRPRCDVPPELTNLLLEFTVNVLVERPDDIVAYAANYFAKLREDIQRNGQHQLLPPAISENDELALSDDEEEPLPKPQNRYARRKSVFAEQYDPEEEDDEVEKVVYPKTDEQRQRLGEAVKTILLFRSLDLEQMQEVIDAMFERKVHVGEQVIKQGDDGDFFYVIERGVYNIHVNTDHEKNKLVGKYDNAGSFGELALMYNMPRAATIEAASEGSLWAMNRQTFRRIVLKSAFKKRKEYEMLLEGVPMLQSLETYERVNLSDALMPKLYRDGDLIIKQGDEADGMFFIEDGAVRITVRMDARGDHRKGQTEDDGDEEVEVSKLTKGKYFGVLDVHAFERLLGPCKEILRRNINEYEEQLIKIFGSKANISDLR